MFSPKKGKFHNGNVVIILILHSIWPPASFILHCFNAARRYKRFPHF